eukprot:1187591-Prorocentrum_minimum.AAC.1
MGPGIVPRILDSEPAGWQGGAGRTLTSGAIQKSLPPEYIQNTSRKAYLQNTSRIHPECIQKSLTPEFIQNTSRRANLQNTSRIHPEELTSGAIQKSDPLRLFIPSVTVPSRYTLLAPKSASFTTPSLNSGGWRVNSGGWRVNSGGWRVNSGGWRVNSGGWRVNLGGWRLNSGAGVRNRPNRPMSHSTSHLTGVRTADLLGTVLADQRQPSR